ncbi:MAG: HlyC/CorC family transporter [Elusimicrobia bacterium]|nr:HlyC/CorC family transporter [Elusimicrobiota bacterium]
MPHSFWSYGLGIFSIPILIAANAFFVATEFALVTVRRTRIQELTRGGKKSAAIVQKHLENLNMVIAGTQFGITLSSIALGWLGEPALAAFIASGLHWLPQDWTLITSHSIAAAIALLCITLLHVVVGELAPKTWALQRPERVSLWVAFPMYLFQTLFRPFIYFLNQTGNRVARLAGLSPNPHASVHSAEELKMLLAESHRAGVIGEQESELLRNVFELPKKRVADIMIPPERIRGLEINLSSEEILDLIQEEGYTRFPVYENSLDEILGIIHTKDLFYLYQQTGLVILHDLLRQPLWVDPEAPIGSLLRHFQRNRLHIALVRKDARTLGLVTLEDILEEITGEIQDEHDSPSE